LGLTKIAEQNPDIVILDMGLPDMDGVTVTSRLREWSNVPVIVLSGLRLESDKVAALEAGADDYVTKPFGINELVARIGVALRRVERESTLVQTPVFEVEQLCVDIARRQVFLNKTRIQLTPTEYKLLAALVRHAGSVMTHHQLLREVWGSQYARETTYVRMYIKRLRQKIEADPAKPRYLLSEPGVGYWLSNGSPQK
jgi:two-component system KDP operon response regulator KdpE